MSGMERAREEIALDVSWLREMHQKKDNAQWKVMKSKAASRPTILEVPDSIRATKPEAYKPKIISLGPFHHQHLRQWDDRLKWPYLNRFLARSPHLRMEDYIKEVKALEHKARSAYPKPVLEMNSNEFTEMMLLDCCFVLEFLLVEDRNKKKADEEKKKIKDKANQKQWWKHLLQKKTTNADITRTTTTARIDPLEKQQQQEAEEDPITSIGTWIVPLVRHDILMLENQLPFFLLRSLYDKAASCSSTPARIKLEDVMLSFFQNFSLFPTGEAIKLCITGFINKEPPPHHLLHLFHSCMRPSPTGYHDNDPQDRLPTIRCARELREAKVKLAVKKRVPILDIGFRKPRFYDVASFWSWRLEIPLLVIDDDTDTLLRNLIAFEQCFSEVGDDISAYAWFMDSIIDNNMDVALLRQRDIVVNGLGSDKDVANLFNQLCKEVPVALQGCYLGKVVNEVKNHCEKCSNKCWASLKHNYFSNRWAFFTVAAAIILFVLTLLQTLYTMLGYLHPKNN